MQTGAVTTTLYDNATALAAAYPFAGQPYVQNTFVSLADTGLTHAVAVNTTYGAQVTTDGRGIVALPQKVSQKEFEGQARLTVNWIVQPSGDSGGFDLLIDGVEYASNLRHDGSTGPQAVTTGTHALSEMPGAGTDLSLYGIVVGGDCDGHGNVTLSSGDSKTCTITLNGPEAVQCFVFDDGYTNEVGPSNAIYISGRGNDTGKACIPQGEFGWCRKWFGRCYTVNTGVPVYFYVFDDQYQNNVGFSDAVYIIGQNSRMDACIPSDPSISPIGLCSNRFGEGVTRDGRKVSCTVFDDGFANMSGLSNSIFVPSPLPRAGAACTGPSSAPLCRRWFGNCQAK
jgi:hypothetical protein